MQLPESERILVFDFGSQYGQLIARRVRDLNVFCQIVRHDLSAERVAELKSAGIILSGGPSSVYAPVPRRARGVARGKSRFSSPRFWVLFWSCSCSIPNWGGG